MKTLFSIITVAASSAFLFVSMLNNQLEYNAAMFNEQPAKFDARLTEMHTATVKGMPHFYKPAFERNKVELSRFFRLVK